jgi:hypothetical protein
MSTTVVPTWADVAAVRWETAPDDWDHVALASYADQLAEFWQGRHAATRTAVLAFLESHRAGVAATDHPRSRLFRGMRGRARRRRQRTEVERRQRHARTQARNELGQFRRAGDA